MRYINPRFGYLVTYLPKKKNNNNVRGQWGPVSGSKNTVTNINQSTIYTVTRPPPPSFFFSPSSPGQRRTEGTRASVGRSVGRRGQVVRRGPALSGLAPAWCGARFLCE